MLRAVAALLAVAIVGCRHQPPSTALLSVCDLSRDFSAYRGKLVIVRGVYFYGLRQDCAQSCATGPWPSFVDLIGTGYTVPGELPFDFRTDDAAFGALDKAERAAEREAKLGRRVEVWATVMGRLRASDHRSPVGPCDRVVNGGYGHLGAFPADLVVQSVSDLELVPNANSPYDYSNMYRGAL
jgi:hypothetical protein